MRKNLFMVSIIAAFAFIFMGCPQQPDDLTPTLQSLIENAKAGTTVELSSKDFTVDNEISINKALTITGGKAAYDLKNAKITVKAAGVVIENVKNVAEVIVDEAVGNGDFTVTKADVKKLTINGGGANSIHIDGTTVATVAVAKENVRLVLEGTSKIESVDLQAACILDSTSDTAAIASVKVAEGVQEVTLTGKININEIEATSVDFKISVASNDIKLQKAVIKAKDGTESVPKIEATSSDIDLSEIELPEPEKTVKYTVNYSTANGKAPESIEVEAGTKLTAKELTSLTADGFTFDGWFIGTKKIEAGFEVKENITLTAKWEKVVVENPDDNTPTGPSKVGFSITLVNESDVKVTANKDASTKDITLTADGNWDSYEWLIDTVNFVYGMDGEYSEKSVVLPEYIYKNGATVVVYVTKGTSTFSSIYFVKGE